MIHTSRFTLKFKEEAVKQMVSREFFVAEVAGELSVSTHSLHKWRMGVKQTKDAKQTTELIEAKSEILRLPARM